MFCNTDLLINVITMLTIACLVGFFSLWFLPRAWITNSKAEYSQSLLRSLPPVWPWLNTKGRVIQVVSYTSVITLLTISSIGAYYETYINCS